MEQEIRQMASGMFRLVIDVGSNRMLPAILRPDIEWVWIVRHFPNPRFEWWDTNLPLSTAGSTFCVRVRNLSFDLVFRTEEFLRNYREFIPHGIDLYQSVKPMPDSLYLDCISDAARDQVLKQNGVFLQFSLPHENETCAVKCWNRGPFEEDPVGVDTIRGRQIAFTYMQVFGVLPRVALPSQVGQPPMSCRHLSLSDCKLVGELLS